MHLSRAIWRALSLPNHDLKKNDSGLPARRTRERERNGLWRQLQRTGGNVVTGDTAASVLCMITVSSWDQKSNSITDSHHSGATGI